MGRGRNQLYASDILRGADFVATGAAHRDRGMHRLALGFVFMTGEAGRRIRLRVQRHRMLRSEHTASE